MKGLSINSLGRFLGLFKDTGCLFQRDEVGQVIFLGTPRKTDVDFHDIRVQVRRDEEVDPEIHDSLKPTIPFAPPFIGRGSKGIIRNILVVTKLVREKAAP